MGRGGLKLRHLPANHKVPMGRAAVPLLQVAVTLLWCPLPQPSLSGLLCALFVCTLVRSHPSPHWGQARRGHRLQADLMGTPTLQPVAGTDRAAPLLPWTRGGWGDSCKLVPGNNATVLDDSLLLSLAQLWTWCHIFWLLGRG